MAYNLPICGLVTRSSSTQRIVRTHWGAGFVKAAGILVLQAPYAATKPKARSPMGFLLSGRNTSDCSSGVIFTIGGSLKRRDDASPYRQRVEGQSAGLTQAHEVVWPIFAGCRLQGLQRRPIAIPMRKETKTRLIRDWVSFARNPCYPIHLQIPTPMHKVTRGWIQDNKTSRGGWTKLQLQLIGVCWPPPHGWIEKVAIGNLSISDEAKRNFEQIAKTYHRNTKG